MKKALLIAAIIIIPIIALSVYAANSYLLYYPMKATVPGGAGGWEYESLPLNFWASDVMLDGVTVIAGSAVNGDLYRSSDEGLTWTKIWNVLDAIRIELIWVDSRNKIFMSASMPIDKEGGLYRSDDGGISFTKVWFETSSSSKRYSSIPPDGMTEDDSGNLYFGTRCREGGPTDIYKSTDSGKTWAKFYSFMDAKHFHFLRFNPYNKWLYASVGDPGYSDFGQWRSKDYGQTWVKLDIGKDPNNPSWTTWDVMGVETYQNYVYLTVHWSKGQVIRFLDDGVSTSFTPDVLHTPNIRLRNWARLYKGQYLLSSGEGGCDAGVNMGVWASITAPFNAGTWQYVYEDGTTGDYAGCACASHRISNGGWLFVANTITGQGIRIRYTAP